MSREAIDCNGRVIKVGDRVQRKVPGLFGPNIMDPILSAKVVDITPGGNVVTHGGGVPVFISETLEVIE